MLALPGFEGSSTTCGVSDTGICAVLTALTPVAPEGIGLPTVIVVVRSAVATLYVFPGVRKSPVMFPPSTINREPGTTATTLPVASVTI